MNTFRKQKIDHDISSRYVYIWKLDSFEQEREEIEFLSSCTIIQQNIVLLVWTKENGNKQFTERNKQ